MLLFDGGLSDGGSLWQEPGGIKGARTWVPVGRGVIPVPARASRFTFLGLSFLVCPCLSVLC